MKILTIAIGESYLNMACTLAASVYGKHDIMLVTDQDVQGRKAELFTEIVSPIYVGETDLETAMINKLHIDEYGNGKPILFLDADTIVTKPIDHTRLYPFEAIVLHKSINYPDWCDHDEVKKLYGFNEYVRQNTSWIYCDGSKMSDVIFEKAREIYIDIKNEKFKVNYFRGEIPDEVCIDIAMSILQFRSNDDWDILKITNQSSKNTITHYLPKAAYRTKPYIPIYLPFINFEGLHHTIDNYYGISIAGSKVESQRVVRYYNEWSEYFAKKLGMNDKSFYRPKNALSTPKKRKGNHNIAVFYHVALMGNWERVVEEQLTIMHMSGLYDNAAKITIGCVGNKAEKMRLNKMLNKYHKINIGAYSENIERYEFITLELLENHAKHFREDAICYIHTKGVTLSSAGHWRAYMNHFNLTLWQKCLEAIADGYDSCGVKYIDESSGFPRHYSGNFWWAYAEHINRLPSVKSLNQASRHEAEMWLCKEVHNMNVMSNIFIDYEKTPYFV